MYVRVTTYLADAGTLRAMAAKLPEIKARLTGLDGIRDWYLAWCDDGQGIVFTVFEDKARATALLPQMRNIWNATMGRLEAPPTSKTFDNVETLDADPRAGLTRPAH